VRIPIEATAHVPINRPDTYQRLPLSTRMLTCERQPVHTLGQIATAEECYERQGRSRPVVRNRRHYRAGSRRSRPFV